YLGIPATNREVVIPGIEFLRFRDGKIAEHWGIYDFMSTAEELGADLTFTPRASVTAPRRPEVPWARQVLVGDPLPDEDDPDGVEDGHPNGTSNGEQEGERPYESLAERVPD